MCPALSTGDSSHGSSPGHSDCQILTAAQLGPHCRTLYPLLPRSPLPCPAWHLPQLTAKDRADRRQVPTTLAAVGARSFASRLPSAGVNAPHLHLCSLSLTWETHASVTLACAHVFIHASNKSMVCACCLCMKTLMFSGVCTCLHELECHCESRSVCVSSCAQVCHCESVSVCVGDPCMQVCHCESASVHVCSHVSIYLVCVHASMHADV